MKIKITLMAFLLSLCVIGSSYAISDGEIQSPYSAQSKREKAGLDKVEKQKVNPAKKSTKGSTDVFVEPKSQVNISLERQYANLRDRSVSLRSEIDAINSSLGDLPKSKAKKALQRIGVLENELNAVIRSMSMYPKSITDPSSVSQFDIDAKAAFMAALTKRGDALIAENDPFEEQISNDPQLEKAYRDYLSSGGVLAFGSSDFDQDAKNNDLNVKLSGGESFYSVLFAITTKPLSKKNFPYDGKVYMQKLKNGKIAYFAGSFGSENEAIAVCNQILSRGYYRDSFVVLVK